MDLVQVVPSSPGGVQDHAGLLRGAWIDQGWRSEVWPLDEAASRRSSLARRLLEVLEWSTVEPTIPASAPRPAVALILHFSGYGYASRGQCHWLLEQLVEARAQLGSSLRVAVYFHELFASGPPWRTAFWLSPWQARLARGFARTADVVLTNAEAHAVWLRRMSPGRRVDVAPVFSNVGEPRPVTAASRRVRRVVVFGSAPTRARARRAFDRHREAVAMLHALGVNELIEVGPGDASWQGLRGWPALVVREEGTMAPAALSRLLQDSAFGLLDYPLHLLAKSSVFAAYASHGCVPLVLAPAGRAGDGLLGGRHYVALDGPCAARIELDDIGTAAWSWYRGHALTIQATAIGRALRAVDVQETPVTVHADIGGPVDVAAPRQRR